VSNESTIHDIGYGYYICKMYLHCTSIQILYITVCTTSYKQRNFGYKAQIWHSIIGNAALKLSSLCNVWFHGMQNYCFIPEIYVYLCTVGHSDPQWDSLQRRSKWPNKLYPQTTHVSNTANSALHVIQTANRCTD